MDGAVNLVDAIERDDSGTPVGLRAIYRNRDAARRLWESAEKAKPAAEAILQIDEDSPVGRIYAQARYGSYPHCGNPALRQLLLDAASGDLGNGPGYSGLQAWVRERADANVDSQALLQALRDSFDAADLRAAVRASRVLNPTSERHF